MTPQLIGLLAGGVFALVNFGALRMVADRVEQQNKGEQGRRTAKALRLVSWLDLIIFPVAGYFIGPMVMN